MKIVRAKHQNEIFYGELIDGKVGEITSDLINSYEDVVNAKDDNFKSYITLI